MSAFKEAKTGSQENSRENALRVAYILHRFPHLTETFIMREMYTMRELGVEIDIFSLLPPKHDIVHPQAEELLSQTHYSPFLSWLVLKAQLHFLRRSPARYLRAAVRLIRQTWREPLVLARALMIFPKSVYFSRQIELSHIDHIHTHFVWLGALAAAVTADLLDITFSIHPHAFGLFGRNQKDVRLQLENASQVTTISTYHAAHIAKICPAIQVEDVQIIHLGVDTDYFKPAVNAHNRNEPVHILSVGRLIDKKGHKYLIEACRLLDERGIDFCCRIAGDGPRQQTLQSLVDRYGLQDRVSLLGRVGQDDVLKLYQTSDIFALPCAATDRGDQDGMPYVLIEAMACEVPVVTTSLSGIPDLVHHGENGLFCRERDSSELADALEALILDGERRRRLGKRARQTILKDFQTEGNVAKLADLLRQLSRRINPPVGESMKTSAGNRVLMLLASSLYPLDSRVQREATSLVAAGYQVSVICPRYTAAQSQPLQEVIDGVHVYRYPILFRGFGLLGYLWGYVYTMAAMSLLSLFVFVRRGFDVVHAHNPPDVLAFIAAFFKLLGKRFVFDHHDLSPEMYQAIFADGSKRPVYKVLVWLETFSCRLADHVIATNESYKQMDMGRGNVPANQITIVRNGPDLDVLHPVEPDLSLRREGKVMIGYVGAIGLHDGVEHLLRALQHLVQDLNRTDFHCILVGGGKLQPRMKALSQELGLAEYVSFTGRVEHAEVGRYLSSVDICVAPEPSNPYNDRSTMIKLGEYMAVGKPVVAFDLPEHRVTTQTAAIYAQPNDERDFADKIAELMDDEERRQEMGRAGRARVEAELAWSHQVKRLLAAYESLHSPRRGFSQGKVRGEGTN